METSGKPHGPNALPRYPLSGKLGAPNSLAERLAEETLAPPLPHEISNELSGLLKEKKFIQNCSGKMWKDVKDTSIILKRILEYDMTWSGFIWHKTKSNDSLMWKCYWSARCNETMEIHWLDDLLPASQRSILSEVTNTKRDNNSLDDEGPNVAFCR